MIEQLGGRLTVVGLACASLGILLSTRGSMGAAPLPLGLMGLVLAAAFGGWLIWRQASVSRVALLLFSLGVALVAVQDFLRPGVSRAHDLQHHAWALWSLWECVLDGDLCVKCQI